MEGPLRIAVRVISAGTLILAACGAGYGAAEEPLEPAAFLGMPSDPRTIALGESILSFTGSPAAVLTNPAASALVFQTVVSVNSSIDDRFTRSHGAGLIHPAVQGSLGVAASRTTYVDSAERIGTAVRSLENASDTVLALNYALPIRSAFPVQTDRGGIGANIKIINSNRTETSPLGIALDLGAIYRTSFLPALTGGIAVRNIGTPLAYAGQSADLPLSFHGALRYDFLARQRLFMTADAAGGKSVPPYSIGIGAVPVYPLAVSLSWSGGSENERGGLRGGVGVDASAFSLSYAYSRYNDRVAAHQVGLTYSFGGFTRPRVAYEHYLYHYFGEARDHYNRGDFLEARRLFEDILTMYPSHLPSKEYLERISQQLDIVEQQQQVEVTRLLRKANVAMNRHDVIKAHGYYQNVLAIDPNNQEAADGIYTIEYLIREAESERLREQNRHRIALLWDEAARSYAAGEYVAAKEKFQELLALDPEHAEAKKYSADIDAQLAKITALQINDLFLKGMGLYNNGDYREAAKYFGAVAVASPDRADAPSYLADCEAKLKADEEKARREKQIKSQDKIKDEVDAAYGEAFKLYERGEYPGAVAAFARARDIAGRYGFAKHEENAKSYITLSRNAIAERHFKLGFDCFQKNKYESAAYEYRKALEYNADFKSAQLELDRVSGILAQHFYELGMKCFSSGEQDKAKEYFKKSLFYRPEKIESLRAIERIP